MGNFSESLLLEGGISAVEFFSDEKHQQEVMDEISEFNDEELSQAFSSIFTPKEEKDEYETELDIITEQQLSCMHCIPDSTIQQEIVKKSSSKTVKMLIKKTRLHPDAEKLFIKRGEMKLILPYFKRYELHQCTQESLVRMAVSSSKGEVMFRSYIQEHCLCGSACMVMLQKRYQKVFNIFKEYQSFGKYNIDYILSHGYQKLDVMLTLPLGADDKLLIAMGLRSKVYNFKKVYPFADDVSDLLKAFPTEKAEDFFFYGHLTPQEEDVLLETADKNFKLVRSYIKYNAFNAKAEAKFFAIADMENKKTYVTYHRLKKDNFKKLIENKERELIKLSICSKGIPSFVYSTNTHYCRVPQVTRNFIADYLSDSTELDKNNLKLGRYLYDGLNAEIESILVLLKETAILSFLIERQLITRTGLEEVIKDGRDDLFNLYLDHNGAKKNLLDFVKEHGTQQMLVQLKKRGVY